MYGWSKCMIVIIVFDTPTVLSLYFTLFSAEVQNQLLSFV